MGSEIYIYNILLIYISFYYIPKSGGSQLTLASVCESKNKRTSPFASLAPANLALINPLRFGKCITRVLVTFAAK